MGDLLKRAGRAIMSYLGLAVRSAENPELLIQQEMDNMKSRLPEFKKKVAMVKANEISLERQLGEQQQKLADLEPKIVAAVEMAESNEDESMRNAAMTLMASKTSLLAEIAATQANLDKAKADSAQAMELRDDFVSKTHAKIAEAQQLLSQTRQTQMTKQMNSLMEELSVEDESTSFNSIKDRVKRDADLEAGKAAVAETSVEAQMSKIDHAVAAKQTDDMYAQYKKQLGYDKEQPAA